MVRLRVIVRLRVRVGTGAKARLRLWAGARVGPWVSLRVIFSMSTGVRGRVRPGGRLRHMVCPLIL